MKVLTILLALSSLSALAAPSDKADDHLTLRTPVKANEVKTILASRSITFLPGFAALPGSVLRASVGSVAVQSQVTIGKYGEELVRPVKMNPNPQPAGTKPDMSSANPQSAEVELEN
ncbi:3-coathanger stack domain-containing protein [Larkinella insperata]|uniref:3-coathanger stack domain-containing protein n=1 Tax=Larkinella insperata TaxID=332158 RepID=A0ABW3QET2_9BACT